MKHGEELMGKKTFRRGFRLLIGEALSAVMIATSAFGSAGPSVVNAAGKMTDPIMVASFWTSPNDTSDTLYFSTDGLNFHEICEAFTDRAPNDPNDSYITMPHHNYAFEGDHVLKWTGSGYEYSGEERAVDITLHDPSIIFYNGYYWMVSGYTEGTGADRRVIIMLSYSKDLIHWSIPFSGSKTNIKLTELPPVSDRAVYYSDKEWDMVAPDFIVDSKGHIYVTFCVGYFAIFHPEDTRSGKEFYDEMFPYMAEITSIVMPSYSDTRNPSLRYVPDPALMPEASLDMKCTYSDAKPVILPCMDTSSEHSRPVGAHNHIDGSIYEEGGYYYYSIKENGVTDEIWRIKDLSKVSDPKAWELVCYDVATGYEGPCLTKYCGQYFMYMDRLASFRETYLDGTMADQAFGSEGIHVIKASTGTTGALDRYTGWLEENNREIRTYRLLSNTQTKPCRHGTVITVSGEAARVVREAALSVGYKESDLYGTVNASDWKSTGWYHQESYLDTNVFGLERAQFHKYYYENDARIGTARQSDIGALRNMDDNPYFFKAAPGDPEHDGMMLCAYIDDGWGRGYPMATVPVDWDYYNKVGREAYGNATTSWVTYIFDGTGHAVKGEGVPGIYNQGGTDDWYRLDPETGHMVKGAYGYENGAGDTCFMWFDLETGKQARGESGTFENYLATGELDGFKELNINRRTYYADMYGTLWYLRYDYADGNAYGPWLAAVEQRGELPEVEYHSPKEDVLIDPGHPTQGNDWYKPDEEDGLWYWYEGGVRQGTSNDPQGVYGIDMASQTAINRGREIAGPDKNGQLAWFWLDSDRQGARAVGKEVWVPYIFQGEGSMTVEEMRIAANESDEGMRDFVFECMVKRTGKWVRYDENGSMMKGWVDITGPLAEIYPSQAGNRYYYDTKTGLMAKGNITIDGVTYYFDEITGVCMGVV